MTTGGMTPAERLKAKSGDYLDIYKARRSAKPKMRNPWLVGVGVVLLVVGVFMLAMGINERLDFPLLIIGIVLIATFGYPEQGL